MRGRGAFVLILLSIALVVPGPAEAQTLSVRGVLFFSPTCGHCEYVIQEVLPPLFDEHGGPWEVVVEDSEATPAFYLLTNGTLELLLADVTVDAGAQLFQSATEAFVIGSNGVPRLIVGNQVMIGSTDIPTRLPALIETGLAGSGIGWPAIPGIETIVAAFPAGETSTTTAAPTTTTTPLSTTSTTTDHAVTPTIPSGGDADRSFGDDPVANSIAIVVLLGLLVALGSVVPIVRSRAVASRPVWLVPILAVVGLAIAGYLSYVEVGGADAVCGPVGDCNVVQQSDYARVAGIPIGLVGLAGYAAVLGLWMVSRRPPARRGDLALVAIALVTVAGTAFSAWLTFLEPFVINATCAWCLGSAIAIGMLLWLTVPSGVGAWRRLAPVSGSEKLPT